MLAGILVALLQREGSVLVPGTWTFCRRTALVTFMRDVISHHLSNYDDATQVEMLLEFLAAPPFRALLNMVRELSAWTRRTPVNNPTSSAEANVHTSLTACSLVERQSHVPQHQTTSAHCFATLSVLPGWCGAGGKG